MNWKILGWGMGISLILGAGWFVAVLFSVLTLGAFRTAANFFGYAAILALPSTLILSFLVKRRD